MAMCRNLTGDNGFRWNNNPVLKEKNKIMLCIACCQHLSSLRATNLLT